MDNNKIIKIGIISVIAIITLAVLVGVLIFTGKDKEVDISPVQEIPSSG
jgi:flagellar basal body-associated protein FliL